MFASLVPEAPRVLVELAQASLTHDLVLASRVFALHLLPAFPDAALRTSLSLVHTLGMRSGHHGDKMAGLAVRRGVTEVSLTGLDLVEAGSSRSDPDGRVDLRGGAGRRHAEWRGSHHRSSPTWWTEARLRDGEPLTIRVSRERLPTEWHVEWAASRERQLQEARRRRGLR